MLIGAPVTAGLLTLAMVGMGVINKPVQPVDQAAYASGQSAGTADGTATTLHCCSSPVIISAPPAPAKPKKKHTAAKKHTPTTSRSGSSGSGSVGDDTSTWPTSVAGWKLTYSSDFPGSSLPSGWGAYSGEPGGDPDGNWDPSNVHVSGGELHLMATPSSQGGVAFYGNEQTYGMYLVRMKGDYEPNLAINNIAILWPAQQGVWPPEVDFYEDSGGNRNGFSASLHAGTNGNDNPVIHSSPPSNSGTAWHTYGVQWTPTELVYTIDGKTWGTVSKSSLDGGEWPDIPMILTLQSQNQGSAQPSGTIETMTVAWVAEYSMS